MPKNYHETRFSHDRKRDIAWKTICKYLQRFIGTNETILDLGAGYCDFINNIQGGSKHALDIFPEIKKYASTDVIPYPQSCADLSNFQKESIDVVFASNLLEHLTREDADATLKEIFRVLRAGGRVITIQPNFTYCYRHYFDDYTHIQIYTHAGLSDLLQSHGFSLTYVKGRFLPFSVKTRFPVLPIIIHAYMRSPIKPFAGQMLHVAQKSL